MADHMRFTKPESLFRTSAPPFYPQVDTNRPAASQPATTTPFNPSRTSRVSSVSSVSPDRTWATVAGPASPFRTDQMANPTSPRRRDTSPVATSETTSDHLTMFPSASTPDYRLREDQAEVEAEDYLEGSDTPYMQNRMPGRGFRGSGISLSSFKLSHWLRPRRSPTEDMLPLYNMPSSSAEPKGNGGDGIDNDNDGGRDSGNDDDDTNANQILNRNCTDAFRERLRKLEQKCPRHTMTVVKVLGGLVIGVVLLIIVMIMFLALMLLIAKVAQMIGLADAMKALDDDPRNTTGAQGAGLEVTRPSRW